MIFTAELGTALSMPGNIALGLPLAEPQGAGSSGPVPRGNVAVGPPAGSVAPVTPRVVEVE